MREVRLQEEAFTLLDLPPVAPQEVLARELARGERRNAAAQFNADRVEGGCQTDAQPTRDAEAQFPDDVGRSAGGRFTVSSHERSQRLARFLFSAAQVVETLLEGQEGAGGEGAGGSAGGAAVAAAARGPGGGLAAQTLLAQSASVELPPWLAALPPRYVHLSAQPSPALLVCHARRARGDGAGPLAGAGGVLTVWDPQRPGAAPRVLLSHGVPLCAVLSAPRPHVAVAGHEEGSLALWDLREAASLHRVADVGDGSGVQLSLRAPSFSTSHQLGENHEAPVVRVAVLPVGDGGGGGGTSFQIASLDERGGLIVWTVLELQRGDLAGSESDLGLGIGSRVRLIRVARLALQGGAPAAELLDLAPHPLDGNQLLAASSHGAVLRVARFGDAPSPAAYAESGAARDPCLCVDVSAAPPHLLAAGFASGSVRVFHPDASAPQLALLRASDAAIVAVAWARGRKSEAVVAVDADGCVLSWSLAGGASSAATRVGLVAGGKGLVCARFSADRAALVAVARDAPTRVALFATPREH